MIGTELLDDPHADPVAVRRELRDIVRLNTLFGGTRAVVKELETIFLAEKDQKAIGSRWLYNQKGAGGWPGDLGYWIGYRVAKSYYDRAPDKTAAIKAIIEMRDPAAFLAASGWVDTASP